MLDVLEKRITRSSPIHMVLVADDSSSMREGQQAAAATEALHAWVSELCIAARGKMPYFRVSVIVFGSHAQVLADQSDEFRAENLDVLDVDISGFVLNGTSGTTNMAEALGLAREILERDDAQPGWCPPFVFVFSDGRPTNAEGYPTDDAEQAALREADLLKQAPLACGSPFIVTLGFGKAKASFMRSLASSEALYIALPNAQALVQLLPAIGTPTVDGTRSIGDFIQQIERAGTGVRDR